jgi:hypothetical protein
VIRGSGINDFVEAFTLDQPQGERRELLMPSAKGER